MKIGASELLFSGNGRSKVADTACDAVSDTVLPVSSKAQLASAAELGIALVTETTKHNEHTIKQTDAKFITELTLTQKAVSKCMALPILMS